MEVESIHATIVKIKGHRYLHSKVTSCDLDRNKRGKKFRGRDSEPPTSDLV